MFFGHFDSIWVNKLPDFFYWDTKDNIQNEMVANAMRRNRFIQILRYAAENIKMQALENSPCYKYFKIIFCTPQVFGLR